MIDDPRQNLNHSRSDLERGDDATWGTPPCPSTSTTCVCHALNSSCIHTIGPCQTHLKEFAQLW